MRVTRRTVLSSGLAGGFCAGVGAHPLSAFAQSAWSRGGKRLHGDSLVGAPKYGPDFQHVDYVRVDAPKGGVARIDEYGGFDSFNPYIVRGDWPRGVVLYRLNDSLMAPAFDQGSAQYGLIAEWVEEPENYAWAAYKIRDGAHFHDGAPITPADVIFSIDVMKTKSAPFYRYYYQNVASATDEGDNIVLFTFETVGNRELPHIIGQLDVLPKHWWAGRAFDEPTLEPPLGSGPYRIGQFEAGRAIVFERVRDYWAADLPINRGLFNFDELRVAYYNDRDIAFEAFKVGDINYWRENSAKRWALQYDFDALTRGDVTKIEHVEEGPKQVQCFAMNQRRPAFKDRRIREAIGLAFDFEFSNRKIYYDQYARPWSYFQGSPRLMATGLPDEAERALLEPFRDALPADLFEKPYENPKTDGSGNNRRNLRRARRLLDDAGCALKGDVLHLPTGEPLEIEFLLGSSIQEVVITPFLQNLRDVLGIQARSRTVDPAQYVNRVRDFDYDMIIHGVANSESPGNEQRDFWSSAVVDSAAARNRSGVNHPAVDALIEKIIFAPDRLALETASRALDRVLLWEHVCVLQLYTPFERIAHWTKIDGPDPLPPRDAVFPHAWWSTEA